MRRMWRKGDNTYTMRYSIHIHSSSQPHFYALSFPLPLLPVYVLCP